MSESDFPVLDKIQLNSVMMSPSRPKKPLAKAPVAAEAAALTTTTWVEQKAMTFPTGLPMEHMYRERRFYVRTCYSTYYEIVLKWLNKRNMEMVTVTGTPGIGKSVFYAYFLKRFSFDAKEATIITASFSRESVMTEVAVWEGGEMLDSATKDLSEMNDLIRKTEKEARYKPIYLYDGAPKIHQDDVQTVVFTSPDKAWFNYIRKDATRPKVIMPLWSLEELETAAMELDLALDTENDGLQSKNTRFYAANLLHEKNPERDTSLWGEDEEAGISAVEFEDVSTAPMVADLVEQRFKIFGGVARACLSTDEGFVKEQQDYIETSINKFKEISELRAILNQEKDHEKMYYGICYFVPNEEKPRQHTIAELTPFVKQLLIECLSDLTKTQREAIVNLLQHNPAAESFRGALLENRVHDQLNAGCTFQARQFGETEEDSKQLTFTCTKSTPHVEGKAYCYFDQDFSSSVLSSGPYHVPVTMNFAAVDSFYYEKMPSEPGQAPLCLFQMTVARSHPVRGAGLVDVLRRLALLEEVRANPKRVALIFVVPVGMEQAFMRQKIELDGLLGDADRVRSMDNIGAVVENILKNDPIRVHTIGDLRVYLKKNENKGDQELVARRFTFGRPRKILSDHDEKQAELDQGKKAGTCLTEMLASIPQLGWGGGVN